MSEPMNIASCITETSSIFDSGDDIRALSRVHEGLQCARNMRNKRRQESRAILQDLSRTLEHAKRNYAAVERSAEPDHDMVMNALDREKFGLAKNINDVETLTHSMESQLRRSQEEYEAMEEDVTKEAGAFDHDEATVLKLSVYRDLGISLRENEGVYDQAVVRSADGKDVHIVTLDSRGGGSYANHLWDLCS